MELPLVKDDIVKASDNPKAMVITKVYEGNHLAGMCRCSWNTPNGVVTADFFLDSLTRVNPFSPIAPDEIPVPMPFLIDGLDNNND